MSRYDDVDSPDYNDTNLGDMRETPEEKLIAKLERDLTALRERLAAAENDAERYRWMKANRGDWYAWSMRTSGSNNLDAAIDAAREKEGE